MGLERGERASVRETLSPDRCPVMLDMRWKWLLSGSHFRVGLGHIAVKEDGRCNNQTNPLRGSP